MPTYDYHCEKCNKSFEVFQSMKADVLDTCPEDLCCMETWGKGPVKRQIGTGAGLIFKGSGFYITDYRSEGYREAAKKDSSASTSSSETKSSETKSKPASATSESKKAKD
jgi:putative FmdB family regulatory protein